MQALPSNRKDGGAAMTQEQNAILLLAYFAAPPAVRAL
jgi:hypothetical protein